MAFLLLTCSWLIITSCSSDRLNEIPETIIPPSHVELNDIKYSAGFIELYRSIINQEDYEVFFVKGIAGETVSKTGKKIKIIEDLKGNFKDHSSIILWGAGGGDDDNSPYNEGVGRVAHYAVNDTLIMLMEKQSRTADDGITREYYLTCMSGYSTLALSNGQVSGVINSDYKIRTMNWEKLRVLLDNYCPQKTGFVDNYKANIHRGDVFFIKGLLTGNATEPYGQKIKPVEDLKGNFPEDLSTVVLWGAGDASGCVDKLQWYNAKDTILALMRQIDFDDYTYPTGKSPCDYETIDCAYSTLLVSEGSVRWEEGGLTRLEEFLELLNRE